MYVKLRQNISAARICEAFSEQLWKEAKALRNLFDEKVADKEVLRIDASVLCGTTPHQISQDMLVRGLPNPLPFLAFFATRSSVSAMVRRYKRYDKRQLNPHCTFKVDVHVMHMKT